MKTVGIIAEYNPFHNGHLYQLEKAKELTGADYAVILMSGNFTQRGIPAIIDKYDRTFLTLSCGGDLVLELPVHFACASAEYFATGAVSILDALGVDYLCFGSECGEITPLTHIAAILNEEPSAYTEILQAELKKGVSFPVARQKALEPLLPPSYQTILDSPNNILGIEYLKALLRLHSFTKPVTISREGAGYSDTKLTKNIFCSALAVRNELMQTGNASSLHTYLPEVVTNCLNKNASDHTLLSADDFSLSLFYKLLSEKENGFTSYADVSQAISDKIVKALEDFSSWTDFCERLKTKEFTHTRMSRSLLHILLNLKQETYENSSTLLSVPYVRILGFRKEKKALFSLLKTDRIVLLSKLADATKLLSEDALLLLKQDIFASTLYESVKAHKKGGTPQNEYRREIIIL